MLSHSTYHRHRGVDADADDAHDEDGHGVAVEAAAVAAHPTSPYHHAHAHVHQHPAPKKEDARSHDGPLKRAHEELLRRAGSRVTQDPSSPYHPATLTPR